MSTRQPRGRRSVSRSGARTWKPRLQACRSSQAIRLAPHELQALAQPPSRRRRRLKDRSVASSTGARSRERHTNHGDVERAVCSDLMPLQHVCAPRHTRSEARGVRPCSWRPVHRCYVQVSADAPAQAAPHAAAMYLPNTTQHALPIRIGRDAWRGALHLGLIRMANGRLTNPHIIPGILRKSTTSLETSI